MALVLIAGSCLGGVARADSEVGLLSVATGPDALLQDVAASGTITQDLVSADVAADVSEDIPAPRPGFGALGAPVPFRATESDLTPDVYKGQEIDAETGLLRPVEDESQ